jgi:hypothetical protein
MGKASRCNNNNNNRIYSASNKNEYLKQKKMLLGSKARPERKADNFTDICEATV